MILSIYLMRIMLRASHASRARRAKLAFTLAYTCIFARLARDARIARSMIISSQKNDFSVCGETTLLNRQSWRSE
jgi:hypothetical protein